MNDSDYLRTEQYADERNLSARIALHHRYSTNPEPFSRWMFSRLRAPAEAEILEVGCGPATIWRSNRDRVPPGWRLTLTDFSPGMIQAARAALGEREPSPRFEVADVQSLPFADAEFDLVIANHMLYHVADRPGALAEIARVLRSEGTLQAATNGAGHMRELDELVERCGGSPSNISDVNFSLQNGTEQLALFFDAISLEVFTDSLEVTSVDPLIDYVRSLWKEPQVDLDRLRLTVHNTIEREGAYTISKSAGLFTCRKRG